MLKTTDEIASRLCRVFERDWHHAACGDSMIAWPVRIPVGTLTKADLEADFAGLRKRIVALDAWAASQGFEVLTTSRRVSGTIQTVPTHVVVHGVDELARALGRPCVQRLATGRERAIRLRELFASKADFPRVVKMLDDHACDEDDFGLVCKAAAWFARNDASGLTARQVPLEGFHAKWLDAKRHKEMVRLLCGGSEPCLLTRPVQINFTYLCPEYKKSGLRRHDSHVEGDRGGPAYPPRTVVISENRDTALWFPDIPKGIAIQGDGWKGQEVIGRLDWVKAAETVVYWGDMDAAGFEILNAYRAHGLDVRSIFMDSEAFERYERFGTRVNPQGEPLKPARVRLDFLADSERMLYERLTDPEWTRPYRVEQERIPLAEAQRKVLGIVGA